MSGSGRAGAARTLAPRNTVYGKTMGGLVGSARQGCGGGESPGLELVGGDALTEDCGVAGAGTESFTTCLVLQ